MNAELEKWVEENTVRSRGIKVVTVQDLRALFAGKVLVPVEIAPAIARAVDLLGRHGDAFADLGAMTILQDFLAASQEQGK
jgi:hypothetical protein